MSEFSPLRELVMTRIRAFLREPEALFWTFVFPILMAVGLGVAFRDKPADRAAVGVQRGSIAERYLPALRASGEIRVVMLDDTAAERAVRKGDVAVVLAGTDHLVYRYDPARDESRVGRLLADEAVQRGSGAPRPVATADDRHREPGARYIDWVIPGLIGLNLMSTGMWGIGFGLVQMRNKKQLKRLVSTPMRKRDYLTSMILARLVFIALEVPPIILFSWLAFGVRVRGSLLALLGLVILGAMTFAGLGLLAASRARTIEGISGILNVVMLPMFVLSGVFFSSSRYPEVIQPFIRALPLTALNDAFRAVYNDALPISAYWPQVAILVAWMVLTFVAALKLFRWQ
ncbi:ABC transporter permease [Longimicrobium sp.]|uniref:ABC transporter permease n=1 Tax=Longimicrobium sp. TaxID=2029185 RepID=UPI002B64C335|nr:ABC transporter permease [Longimicrobium sp.]HSU17742.1 ABC transporter permease [Longimicrobium sp.]